MRIKLFFIIFGFSFSFAQNVVVKGKVVSKTEAIPYAEIIFNNAIAYATYSDEKGNFKINIPYGMYKVKVKSLGLKVKEKTISITTENSNNLEIELVEDLFGLEQVVVSATRNRVNKKEAPIIVNTLGEKLINATQSLAVSERLIYIIIRFVRM